MQKHSFIESLEPRVVLSTGPSMTGIELTGSMTAVTSVVLTFNAPLDPATAQNLQSYAFGKPPPAQKSSDGFDFTDLLFRKTNRQQPAMLKPKLVKNGKIQFASAVYDATDDTVTLTPLAAFKAQAYFRFLRVKGMGPNKITDDTGVALNGGFDQMFHWKLHQGKTIHFTDGSHDHVTLKLQGPGKLSVFTVNRKSASPVIFVQSSTSATVITGTVKNNGALLPNITVAEIEGLGDATTNLLNNPSFTVVENLPQPGMQNGIIIVDHGSRREESNKMLEHVAELFAARFREKYDIVEPAHMELAEPSIATAYANCVRRGADRVVVIPFFLGPGKHWTQDIPRLTVDAAKEFPHTRFHVTPTLGVDDLILDLLQKRAGHCEANIYTCDLCKGTLRCGESAALSDITIR